MSLVRFWALMMVTAMLSLAHNFGDAYAKPPENGGLNTWDALVSHFEHTMSGTGQIDVLGLRTQFIIFKDDSVTLLNNDGSLTCYDAGKAKEVLDGKILH